tara:strand:- start:3068 stop:3460 length:393 start_codon:yes stop_codon:yes gene_type:complete
MAKVSADIAETVDITLRRGDSFYLKVDLTNEDGSNYNLYGPNGVSAMDSNFEVYNNDELVLGYAVKADGISPPMIASTINIDPVNSTLTIVSAAANQSIYSGTYKYKFYVTDYATEHNTIMVGKFKVIDL